MMLYLWCPRSTSKSQRKHWVLFEKVYILCNCSKVYVLELLTYTIESVKQCISIFLPINLNMCFVCSKEPSQLRRFF